VIGSTVNIASRLESMTKEYGMPIILPEAVFLTVDESTQVRGKTHDLGLVKIRGIEHEMKLGGVQD
jgi:class 3 adenylate cyclase